MTRKTQNQKKDLIECKVQCKQLQIPKWAVINHWLPVSIANPVLMVEPHFTAIPFVRPPH